MKPIHFQGLNCYHDCLISIANHWGIHYPSLFAALWSETEFSYDPYRQVYLTKRMINSLEVMGVKIEKWISLLPTEFDKNLSALNEGEFLIAGMDAFSIPWNQFYQIYHGPHYFVLQNTARPEFLCIDPTYRKTGEYIARNELIKHAFEIIRLVKNPNSPLKLDLSLLSQAQEVIANHPVISQTLVTKIQLCVNKEPADIVLLAKYIDTLIQNRYLYRFFLEKQHFSFFENSLFFHNSFFEKWHTVKNALYKAAVSKNNNSLLANTAEHLQGLLAAEIAMAEEIICR